MPTGVSSSFSSVSMRHKTGNACRGQCAAKVGCVPALETYGDGHGNTYKKHVDGEIDVDQAFLVPKLFVKADSYGASQAERNGHADDAHVQCDLPVAHQVAQIDLEADDEKEEHETEIGDQIKLRHGGIREDVSLEAGDAAHGGWAQQNTSNDLGDDARLAELVQGPFERTAEADYDDDLTCSSAGQVGSRARQAYLNDEQDDRILRVDGHWTDMLEHTSLGCCVVCSCGRGRSCDSCSRDGARQHGR